MRKVLRMTDGWMGRLNTPALALTMTIGAVLAAGFGGIFGNCPASAGDLADPPPAQSEIRVTFSPNPAKTGFVKDSAGNFESSLLKHVIATVSPPSARVDITFSQMWEEEGTGRIEDFRETLEESGNDKWEFDVGGTYESNRIYPWGDIIILAWYKGSKAVGVERVIVQVPKKIGTPHDQRNGVATSENIAQWAGSSPATNAPAGQAEITTFWGFRITVVVWDQFDSPLGDVYATQLVYEDIGAGPTSTNLRLDTSGAYLDPVGGTAHSGSGPGAEYIAISDATTWQDPQGQLGAGSSGAVTTIPGQGQQSHTYSQGQKITIPGTPGQEVQIPFPASFDVFVAGHKLVGGVQNRNMYVTPPNSIRIDWPDN